MRVYPASRSAPCTMSEPAFPVATGKVADSHSSGTRGTPSPTKGPVPAVPMRYRAQRKLRKCEKMCEDVWICGWNIAVVVFLLLAVWFNIIIPHGVLSGILLPAPPPPSPPLPPQAPTTCPFDVVACNLKCALMHVNCTEFDPNKNNKNKKRDCNALHGRETASGSTASFTTFTDKRAHLMSLDWEHEPSLWGLRAKHIGDGHCDRSGCGATLCECNFEGGDCVSTEESGEEPYYPFFLLLSALIYLGTMLTCLLYTSPSPRDRQKSRMPSSA